mmetsp:Transcript_5921/g.9230  ORF Transcript_5921/g.9230 Transcript_5921/m.9230 type:complete len:552 (+) Transcript_5921:60-1715(+)
MSRKGEKSLNHLLNFSSYDNDVGETGRGRGDDSSRRRRQNSGQNKHAVVIPFNREDYVKANFRFALKPATKCRAVRGKDGLEWDDVECVLVKSDDAVSCAICLDDARVPRITTCGHIFCCLCVYRLFAHSEEVWEKCPLCSALIRENTIKRVSEIALFSRIVVGQKINFKLLKRIKTGVIPILMDSTRREIERLPDTGSERAHFSRLSIQTSGAITKACVQENRDLQYLHSEAVGYNDGLGASLIARIREEIQVTYQLWNNGEQNVDAAKKKHSKKKGNLSRSRTSSLEEDWVYFYQLEDGRMVFPDPFVSKCLAHQYQGDWSQFPHELAHVNVLSVRTMALTPELVKRNPFLVHIPIHANVSFVDVDVSTYLNDETREKFKDEFGQRAKRRLARQRKERLHEKNVQAKMKNVNVDYKEYQQRLREQDEEIQKVLSEGFVTSLTGDRITTESEPLVSSPPSSGSWNSVPAGVGSFSTMVNSHGHFPELASSPTKSELSTSPGGGNEIKAVSAAWGGAAIGSQTTQAAPLRTKQKSKSKKGMLISSTSRRRR